MSWSYDFGIVADADELRDHDVKLNLPKDQFSTNEAVAVAEHVEAARQAAIAAIQSPAFSDSPVLVQASGQANEDHEPRQEEVAEHQVGVREGKPWIEEVPVTPAAAEHITITIVQQPRE